MGPRRRAQGASPPRLSPPPRGAELPPAATSTPRLCPPPSGGRGAIWSQSRACCRCEEGPRRFTAVTLSMDPELELLFIFDFHSKGAAISRQLKSAGKGRWEAAFSAMCSPGRTCLRRLGGATARSLNTRKRGDPANFPLPPTSARAQKRLGFTWDARLGDPPSRPGAVREAARRRLPPALGARPKASRPAWLGSVPISSI